MVSTGSDSGVHTRRSVPVCESMSRTKRVMVIVRPSALWHKARIAYSSRVLILRGACDGFNVNVSIIVDALSGQRVTSAAMRKDGEIQSP